jgi:hypothetical protein
MHLNRIPGDGFIDRLPPPPRPAIQPGAFVLVGRFGGVSTEQWNAQQWLYRQALEQALAVARPSILERDLLLSWN